MKIYTTTYDAMSPDLENQLMLEAQVKYAIATDHTHIIDSNEMLFTVHFDGDEYSLVEVEQEYTCSPDAPDETDDDSEDVVTEDFTNPELIDLIINNSLNSRHPITLEQAQTMLVLAKTKSVLIDIEERPNA
jgi:hypothetical protein